MTPPNSTEPGYAYVCLGSNIRPATHLPLAVERLAERVEVVGSSRVYESAAKGRISAPPFLNAAVALLTDIGPLELKFDVLRPLEAALGRVRTDNPDEPRTIDLDLALFGDLVVDDSEAGLVLPEPEILTCAHVALPLADLAPRLAHPTSGETLAAIASRLGVGAGIRLVDRPRLPFNASV